MKVYEKMTQGSDEWFNARKGRATASQFSQILTPTGKPSKSAKGYMRRLARECVLDDPQEFAGNKFTEWGLDHEEFARNEFEQITGMIVHEVGFCNREDGSPVGCSPDGLIKSIATAKWLKGMEIKCPSVDKHVEYVMAGDLPSAYKLQVHGSMAVTGLDSWYFMSYFPSLNPLIIEVKRDSFTELVSDALDDFIIEYKVERELVLKAITPTK
jgi:predicted phage-related endonuclease